MLYHAICIHTLRTDNYRQNMFKQAATFGSYFSKTNNGGHGRCSRNHHPGDNGYWTKQLDGSKYRDVFCEDLTLTGRIGLMRHSSLSIICLMEICHESG